MGISVPLRLSGTRTSWRQDTASIKAHSLRIQGAYFYHGDDGLERHTKKTRQENHKGSKTNDASTHARSGKRCIRTRGVGLGAIERADGRSKRRDGAREACSWRAS